MNRREVFSFLATAPVAAAIAKDGVGANWNDVAPVQENLCRWMGQDLPLREAVRRYELLPKVLRQQTLGNVGQECFGG